MYHQVFDCLTLSYFASSTSFDPSFREVIVISLDRGVLPISGPEKKGLGVALAAAVRVFFLSILNPGRKLEGEQKVKYL